MRTYCVVADYVGGVIAFYALGYSEVYELQLFVDLYNIYTYIYIYIYINKYVYVHIYTHTQMYIQLCVCARACVYDHEEVGGLEVAVYHALFMHHLHSNTLATPCTTCFSCTTCPASIIAFRPCP
jgi:hypothetical protein